jgi:nucleotide-binding universal stress UspA family protein
MPEIKDILLPLSTYPDPTPDYIVDWSVRFAALCGGRISAIVSVLDRKKVARSYARGSWMLDVPALIDAAISSSNENGRRLLERFEKEARALNVLQDELQVTASMFASADHIVGRARLRDLVLIPVTDFVGMDEPVPEDTIFGTGRPVILLPAYQGAPQPEASLERIVVAWDSSRAAARALADAMPLLQKAKKVYCVTVRGEKDLPATHSSKEVERHLQMHGILAETEEVSIEGRTIGDALMKYIAERRADILVMGAFGHSQLREFVLGGASRSVIRKPPLPVFMSH